MPLFLALCLFISLFNHSFAEPNFDAKRQCLPISPTFFAGKAIKKNNEWTHYLRWGPASDPNVTSYQVFQNNALIRTVAAKGPFEVILPNQSCQNNTDYELIAVTSEGTKSCPLPLTLGPCQRQAYTPCCKCKAIRISTQIVNPTQKANGKILINASGGTPPYLYSIDGGATYQKSNLFFGLPAGTYTLAVKDKNGCKSTASVTLRAVSTLSLSFILTNQCPSDISDDSSIKVFVTGGAPPYFFSIDGGLFIESSSPFTFNSLAPGNHTITVKDSAGHSVSETVTLTPLTLLNVSVIQGPTQPTCANGQVQVILKGGNPPYNFELIGTTTSYSITTSITTVVFQGIAAGIYSLVIVDSTGCKIRQDKIPVGSVDCPT